MKTDEYFNEGRPFESMKPALSKTAVSGSCFGIRAECRTSKKRVIIKRNMTKETAEAWIPDGFIKKMYRYFRVVDVNNYR